MAWRSPHDCTSEISNAKRNALFFAILFSLAAFVLQTAGAWYTGSLALLGDTAHLFTDLLSLIMSLAAVLLAARPTNNIQSFGLYRLEVLAAFLNGILLLVVAASLGYESFERLQAPREVLALPLLAISTLGLLLNILSAVVLSRALHGDELHAHHGHHHGPAHGHNHDHSHQHDHGHGAHKNKDRNLNSAFLHVLSDAMSSVAVMAGAVAVYFTGYNAVDAAVGLLLSFVILYWAYRLIMDTAHVLLEATPRHIEAQDLVGKMKAIDSRILAVNDLHVWEITSRMYAATAEVKVETMTLAEAEALRLRLNACLKSDYGIAHAVLALHP